MSDHRQTLENIGLSVPPEWDVQPLESLLSEDRGVSVGVMYPGDHTPTGIPLIKVGDLSGNRINPKPQFRISTAVDHDYRRTRLEGGELLLTLVGGLGQCAVVPPTMNGWNAARAVAVIRLKHPSDACFVRACLLADPLQKLMHAWSNTTVQATLNLKEVRALPVPWPTIRERQAIARILGALDDKIELNRQMNETLEALARALFQSWFVDFDPVRAKMRGEQPVGMDAATAALFPSRLVQTEHGEVPEGWSLVPLSDAAELNPSLQLSRASPAPYVEMSSLPTRGSRPTEWPLREVGSGARFMNGDTLFARITPCLENGKTGFVDFLREGEVGWGSTEYVVIRPRAPLPAAWGYLLARDPTFREFAAKKMEGTTGRQRVAANALARYIVCRPHKTIAQAFGEVIQPIFKKLGANDDESKTLAATRDLLLPRLLSGELRVPDAERLVAEAV
jgi:type I restriction enzyme S subunit